jgi:mRNA interferase MazF
MIKYFLQLLDWCKLQFTFADARQNKNRLFHEREVWWCSIGLNVGDEVFGKGSQFARPVLIFKKFTGSSFFGIPLTSKIKVGSWYVPVDFSPNQQSFIMLHQGRVLGCERLLKKMIRLNPEQFSEIKVRFAELYNIKDMNSAPLRIPEPGDQCQN